MFTGMLHTHKLAVTLFLVIYLVKTVLLLTNKTEALQKVVKKTKVAEMIISLLFLVTGVYLILNIPQVNTMMVIKLVCVFASIPLAVVGFKKSNKPLAALAFVLIVASYGLAEMSRTAKVVRTPSESGLVPMAADLYTNNCASCHGGDGKLGIAGAKDLSASTLTDEEMKKVISNGKNAMPKYGTQLSEEEINALVEHVKSLKK